MGEEIPTLSARCNQNITKVTRKKVTTLQNNQEKIANQNTTKSSEMNIASDQTIIS